MRPAQNEETVAENEAEEGHLETTRKKTATNGGENRRRKTTVANDCEKRHKNDYDKETT